MHEELSRARIDEERVKQKLEVVAQENEKLKAWRDDLEKEIEILKEEINKAEQARAKVLYEAEKERSESQVQSLLEWWWHKRDRSQNLYRNGLFVTLPKVYHDKGASWEPPCTLRTP